MDAVGVCTSETVAHPKEQGLILLPGKEGCSVLFLQELFGSFPLVAPATFAICRPHQDRIARTNEGVCPGIENGQGPASYLQAVLNRTAVGVEDFLLNAGVAVNLQIQAGSIGSGVFTAGNAPVNAVGALRMHYMQAVSMANACICRKVSLGEFPQVNRQAVPVAASQAVGKANQQGVVFNQGSREAQPALGLQATGTAPACRCQAVAKLQFQQAAGA